MAQLLSNIETFKANFGALDANFNWENLEPFVTDVERDILGETLGEEVIAFFPGENLTAVQIKALVLLRRSTAYLSMLKWSETSMFRFTDVALYLAKSKDGAIPSDKKIRDLKNFLEETGFNFLDKTIALMEADLSSFTVYRDSGVRQTMQQGFIRTAKEFSDQKSINNSRITFMSMLSIMLDVQDRVLPGIMGDAYYEQYKEHFLDGSLTLAETKLLPMIRKAVAHLTISEACNDLPLKVTSKGIFINKFVDAKEYDQQDAADAARIQFMSDGEHDKGQRKLGDLRAYLISKASQFPDFVPPAASTSNYNSADSGFYFF